MLISGANKGIGYEAAKLLAHQMPHTTILLGTRSLDNGHKAVQKMKDSQQQGGSGSQHSFDNVKPIELDVTSKTSLDKAAQHVKSQYGRLDVLMCNAGVAGGHGETAETVFATNIDGVHDMIEAFLPMIPATGHITVVASEVGTWAVDEMPPQLQQTLTSPQTATWPLIQQLESDWLKAHKGEAHEQPWPDTNKIATGAYSVSKAIVIVYLRYFASQHKQPKVTITTPGYCATDLNHNSGYRTAAQGGESVSWPVLHASEAESGQFYSDGEVQPFIQPVPEYAKANFKQMEDEIKTKQQAQQK